MYGIIKIPCYNCGKPKMIKTAAYTAQEYTEIIVLDSCYRCGFKPKSNRIEYEIDRDKDWLTLTGDYRGFELHEQGPTRREIAISIGEENGTTT